MREMIQTERDYVKSLEYIIEVSHALLSNLYIFGQENFLTNYLQNYIPELVREDIPQALRGQRNVIFGNVEKIYEFHSQHFLRELEQCEQCPMFVGQCFIRHVRNSYLPLAIQSSSRIAFSYFRKRNSISTLSTTRTNLTRTL